jgi:hypothetical protein
MPLLGIRPSFQSPCPPLVSLSPDRSYIFMVWYLIKHRGNFDFQNTLHWKRFVKFSKSMQLWSSSAPVLVISCALVSRPFLKVQGMSCEGLEACVLAGWNVLMGAPCAWRNTILESAARLRWFITGFQNGGCLGYATVLRCPDQLAFLSLLRVGTGYWYYDKELQLIAAFWLIFRITADIKDPAK